MLCLKNCSAKQKLPPCHRTFPLQTCHFFMTKIKQIREDLDSCPHDSPSFFKFDGPELSVFEPVTEELICRLISQSPTKSCTLDPIPATLTKQCLHDLAPLVTRIVSVSLSTGTVPSGLKQALVTPILKKPGLDTNYLRNFRQVSNLPFVPKRVVLHCSLICAQTAYSNSTVCVQKISQYRNCCFECTRRPPYKI